MVTSEDFAKLEQRVAKLEAKPKDFWDKAQVIVSAFVPITLGILSAVISQQGEETRAQLTRDQNRANQAQIQAQVKAAQVTASVERAKLLHEYIPTVFHQDPMRRRLAVEGILLGLGEQGRHFVAFLASAPPSPPQAEAAAAQERLAARFPILVTDALKLGCWHRGGSKGCVQSPGVVITPPADTQIAVFQMSVPLGARKLVGTLTEYSGTSCNEGHARASILVDGIEVFAAEQTQTVERPFAIPLGDNSKVVELRGDSLGDGRCDDMQWRSLRFEL